MMLVDLRIGFERPGDSFISRAIAAHDPPGLFSHAAIVFGKDIVLESHADYGGVRFRKYVPDPKRWVFARPHLISGETEMIREFGEMHAGDPYDMGGVLAIAKMPLVKAESGKWFCSELVVAACQVIGMFSGVMPHLVTPNGLYAMCERDGLLLSAA